MNVNQFVSNVPELCHCRRATINPGSTFSLRINCAAQQQRVARDEARLIQQIQHRSRAVKFGTDIAALRTLAHDTSLGSGAKCKLQCVNQNGFSGPRLAREHRKTVIQIKI